MEEKQPWVTCFLTDILVTYMEEAARGAPGLDYPALFRGLEGFETPRDPQAFLRDVNNWVPLPVLVDLLSQCEKASGKKDVAYHAARAYFDPGKKPLHSLFEIVARVLNDVRSVLICSNLVGTLLSSYLRLQAFERPGPQPDLYMLAQFGENARATVGRFHLLLGICEGFPRLYPFIEDARCLEEISQLRIEDIVAEFPGFTLAAEGDRLRIRAQGSQQPLVEAVKVPLGSETIALSRDFMENMPDPVVVPPRKGQIEVLTHRESAAPTPKGPRAYKIVRPGAISQGTLAYAFTEDRIYNAPYSRLRFLLRERPRAGGPAAADGVRREMAQLLFDHLKQMRQTQMRVVDSHIERRSLRLENLQLRQEIAREYAFAGIVSRSDAMRDVLAQVRSIADTDITVMIQGETGTGKELIARAIHYNSPRTAKRFVAINCGALADTLLESELFGHEKGAFTGAVTQRKGIFEAADGGTLFLDEVGEIKPGTQVKLLRVLQEGEFQRVGGTEALKVDVRVVAATNRRLEDLVAEGHFRQDLYYRLNVFPITVPPLRDRPEDIPLLVSHVLERRKEGLHKTIEGVTPEAMALLMTYGWPGNVRELENVVQRMMVVAKGPVLDVQDLPPQFRGGEGGGAAAGGGLKGIARKSAGIVEKKTIEDALASTGGNVSRAAKALGISRATLQNKMKAYGLRAPKP